MAQQYLLPCSSCGEKTPVEIRQAGETITCRCGTAITVPTLRGLRQLEAVQETAATQQKGPRPWSRLQGVLFSAGLSLAILGVAMAGWQFFRFQQWQPHTQDQTENWDQYSNEMIDNMELMESMEFWAELLKEPLSDEHQPPWVLAQQFAQQHWRTAIVWVGLAVAGLVSVGLSFVLTPRTAARRS